MDLPATSAMVEVTTLPNGLRAVATGPAPVPAAWRRMVPAHAGQLSAEPSSDVEAEVLPAAVAFTVTSADPATAPRIRGLGFVGLVASRDHHREHDFAIARGEPPHGRWRRRACQASIPPIGIRPMRLLLSLLLSIALLLVANMSAFRTLAHGGDRGHGEMAQVDHADDNAAVMECCDGMPGRTAPACGFDAALPGQAFGFVPATTILRHETVQARAPAGLNPDMLLDPPKA